MAGRFIVSFFIIAALMGVIIFRRRRRACLQRLQRESENSLWIELASGLFDSADSPAVERLELALSAISRRLRLRGGLVVLQTAESCRVIASTPRSENALEGLSPGRIFSRGETYCGSVRESSPLVIEYASLSEWRKHEACGFRGWESFVGMDCGGRASARIVVGFFDTVPRHQLFSSGEIRLIEQIAPWIGALATEEVLFDSHSEPLVEARDFEETMGGLRG